METHRWEVLRPVMPTLTPADFIAAEQAMLKMRRIQAILAAGAFPSPTDPDTLVTLTAQQTTALQNRLSTLLANFQAQVAALTYP